MNKYTKAGILLAMLVVPALFFLFLKGFGTNHFALPRYIPRIDSTTGQVIMTTTVVNGREVTDTVFQTIPDFELINQNGKKVNRASLNGKIHIADFFFARCPGICPQMSSQLQRVQDAFLTNPEVVIHSYTVDPSNDTVAALQQYAAQYGAKPGKWHLLTGQKNEIYDLAYYGYRVTAKEDDTTSTNLEDQFVHTDKFVLVDKEGIIRGYYDGTDAEEVDKLIGEIKILLYEYRNSSDNKNL